MVALAEQVQVNLERMELIIPAVVAVDLLTMVLLKAVMVVQVL